MNTVEQVKDKKFALYIHEDKIKARVKEIATQIDEDLRKKNPLFLVLLNGSFVFAADLLRSINFPLRNQLCENVIIRRYLQYRRSKATHRIERKRNRTHRGYRGRHHRIGYYHESIAPYVGRKATEGSIHYFTFRKARMLESGFENRLPMF